MFGNVPFFYMSPEEGSGGSSDSGNQEPAGKNSEVETLKADNFKLREKNRGLRTELDTLKSTVDELKPLADRFREIDEKGKSDLEKLSSDYSKLQKKYQQLEAESLKAKDESAFKDMLTANNVDPKHFPVLVAARETFNLEDKEALSEQLKPYVATKQPKKPVILDPEGNTQVLDLETWAKLPLDERMNTPAPTGGKGRKASI